MSLYLPLFRRMRGPALCVLICNFYLFLAASHMPYERLCEYLNICNSIHSASSLFVQK